ncbi:paraquat-inducible protein A [Nitrincola tapanii]|uniref:Paraquat-inducible protein A n=1 Tax=Nitrincola tapanii TaxID=1708751 RepID=A0A5A9W1W4_9GAMM|nr:paraquat-inducible protein A [Nitrincola tapanii]KAA0874716.1 paraquat-inducible protein A [Nitrincola tapanii]
MPTTHPDYRHLIACNECDLLLHRPVIRISQTARCPRCQSVLISARANSIERSLALACAGLILILPANLYPLLTLELLGQSRSETIFSSAMALFQDGLWGVSLLVLLFTILVPICKLCLLFWVSLGLQMRWSLPGLSFALRSYLHLDEWGMLEVYLVGVLVSVVKLAAMASLEPGPGLFCLAALILVTTLSSSMLDKDLFWARIEALQEPDQDGR